MFTSIGYHTFEIAKNLTQAQSDSLFKAFKEYKNKTGEIYIDGPKEYSKDPHGRHYEIKYAGQKKGIWWRIRFSNKGHYIDDDFKPCSVKAIINPKTLTEEKSYIVAADESSLEDVKMIYDHEAAKVSPILAGFSNFFLNRIDYCINFDVSELKADCPPDLQKEFPRRVMQLIKQGDIPDKYNEEYRSENQFYLKSDSVVVNCYWKYAELEKDFPDCRDLKKSYDIIRFEVQYRYRKARQQSKAAREAYFRKSPVSGNEISRLPRVVAMDAMLSDEKCNDVIGKYFNDIIKSGDYYTFDTAKRIIEAETSSWGKTVRLTYALERIRDYGGISKVKKALQGKELEDFRRSLRELAKLKINPVTIPKEWGIVRIPSLLDNYYKMCAEEQEIEEDKKFRDELLRGYIRDCRKLKIP